MGLRFLSLFSGIEAASQAWTPLGWECAAVAEIEPFPAAVLARRYPDVPNLGDVTKITAAKVKRLGRIDLIVGGFPCQDVSIAGKRKGLKHADGSATRSGLFHDAVRVIRYARKFCRLRWVVLENVPGLFSSNAGRDFGTVVGTLAGTGFDVPRDGWESAGCAVGPDGMVEWSVLDARFRGLAQRRERVFLVGDFGDWAGRAPVLLERESMLGNPPTRRQTRQDTATGPDGGVDGGSGESDLADPILADDGWTYTHEGRGNFRPRNLVNDAGKARGPAFALGSHAVADSRPGSANGLDISEELAFTHQADRVQAVAFGGNRTGGPVDVATAVNAHGGPHGRLDFETETFVTEQQPYSIMPQRGGTDYKARLVDVAQPLTTSGAHHGDQGGDVIVTHALTGEGADASEDGTGRGTPMVPVGSMVRRLTPVECARLQGFPDDYLDVLFRGKAPADGVKYKALGNSFAVPVVRWIGERIAKVSENG
jgi:DNA (cytosine-5)-methyltransferase 1